MPPTRDPHSFADTRQGRIRHIDLHWELDFRTKTVRGSADYHITAPASGPLFFDTRDVAISRIHTDNKDLEWSIDETDRVKGQRLHIQNPNALSRFTIEYETAPGATALGWLEPEHTAGGKYPVMLSQCQAIHARSLLPCQDSPGVRFTYTASVKTPKPLTAAMSADRTEVRDEGDFTICRFDMPQSIPSYLLAVAAGNFAFKKLNSRTGVFAEPEVLADAAWEFADTEDFMVEAEKIFGPYLWETFNLLILPPAFPYGGMENPRLTFLTPALIVGDKSMVNVVAHELAHSWTGNLVTNATWEDFWLNEGWTVYAERRILEVLEGDAYAQLHAGVRRDGLLEDMKVFGMESNPTRLKFSQEGIDPDEVFSMVPYEKGCSFLSLIEDKIGRERFNVFTQKYIERFKFQSLTTDDFLAFLREQIPEVDQLVDVHKWVFEPGFPEEALVPKSPLLDHVYDRLNAYREGTKPKADEVAGWRSQQIEVFLKGLPPQIPVEDCAYLENLWNLKRSRNRNILSAFYVVAIRSGYEQAIQDIEDLLCRVGRMLYLKPIYRALAETGWSKPHARLIFDKAKAGYHPIAVGAVERILTDASL